MVTERTGVQIPAPMWPAMKASLEATLTKCTDPAERKLREEHGSNIFLRLIDKSVRMVRVDWGGCVYFEQYEGQGYVGDAAGAPTFTADDIESWGHYEKVSQPSWLQPLKTSMVWRVKIRANGGFG
jgi:hypothetical protein